MPKSQPSKNPSTETPSTKTPSTKDRPDPSRPETTSTKQSKRQTNTAAPTRKKSKKGAASDRAGGAGRTDVNEVRLRGTLATAPELRTFESGSALARLLVTVRATGNHPRTDVIPVTVWDPSERVSGARRGDRIGVEGSVQRRFWTTPDGRNSRVEVVGNRVTVRRSATSD